MENYDTYSEIPSSLGPLIAVFAGAWALFILLIFVVTVIALWKIFTKAGKPGWAAIVPIYNLYTLLQIIGRPVWWMLLFIIPLVNMIVVLLASIDLARSFKKSDAFGIIGLWFFSIIGYLILGFGDAKYAGPGAKQ